jgi:3'-phosphoadenosine 5'-phosphosulfate sulfotransferase (PAPS reductase)/FAD synthetase
MERFNTPLTKEAAKSLLALDLEDKVITSYEKLDEWYTAWGGQCYVSFSGGKDSTVLAYLAARYLSSFRTPPWALNLVFVNTGLEYPEIQKFVNEYADWLRREFARVTVNLHRLRPKMNIRQVVTRYGYPVIGKKQARFIRDLQNAHGQNDATVNLYLTGYNRQGVYCSTMKLADKWHYLKDAPFHISEQCCDVMKKAPAKQLEAVSGYVPFTAMMASESQQREKEWKRTGCMFCAFGAHLEKGENRFERMKHTHPKHYEFCIGGGAYDPVDGLWKPTEKGLGYARVLDYIGVRY